MESFPQSEDVDDHILTLSLCRHGYIKAQMFAETHLMKVCNHNVHATAFVKAGAGSLKVSGHPCAVPEE